MNLRALLFLFITACAPALRAQESWTVVPSPTARNLWSVACSADTYVAVGEGGTVLTSADGLAWTPRVSGTADWLVGAAYANGQFVVVGDHGVVLTSSDGLTWTPHASGTSERLNAVAFGQDRWLAVGENGSAVTSPDGASWSAVPGSDYGWTSALAGWLRGFCFAYGSFVGAGEHGRLVTTADANYFFNHSVTTAANLEGLTYARHRFVAVGDGGLVLTSADAATWRGSLAPAAMRAITFFNNTFVGAAADGSILTSPDAGSWTIHPTGNTRTLTAVAGRDSTVIAVGFAGVILRATAAQAAPSLVTPPADVTEAAGNHVRFTVTARGTAPLAYQWALDGQPLPGATGDTLPLRSISAANAGHYTVTVSNALGTLTSAPAALTVVAGFPDPGDVVDPSFHPPGQRAPSVLLLQSDGKIILANDEGVSRLRADGALDPDFAGPSLAGIAINSLGFQPDGKILAAGTVGGSAPYLGRLAANGVPDSSFNPSAALPGTTLNSLAVQPDGKILVAGDTTRLTRLNADGSIDSGFVAADVAPLVEAPALSLGIQQVVLAPDGRILIAASPPYGSLLGLLAPHTESLVVTRLAADGSLDPAFVPFLSPSNVAQFLAALPDGKVLLGSQSVGGNYGGGSWTIQRLNADGSNDLTFQAQSGFIPKYGGQMRAAVDAQGRIVVAAGFNNYAPSPVIARFQPDGTPDLTLRSNGASVSRLGRLRALAVQSDGRVIASQDDTNFFRTVAANAPVINPPVVLDDPSPPAITVSSGGGTTFTTAVAGTGPFTHAWTAYFADRTYQSPYQPSADSLTFSNLRQDASLHATLSNAAGSVACPAQLVRVQPSAPRLTSIPTNVTAEDGRSVMLTFSALGSGRVRYQWFFQGREIRSGDLTPANSATDSYLAAVNAGALPLNAVTAATTGAYELVLTSALGTQRATVTVSLAPGSRLIDVATRGWVGAGDHTLIAGFVVTGAGPKWVLLRGVGPGLAPYGVPGLLADPKLTLFDATGTKLDENDDWVGTAESYTAANWPDTFALPIGSRDAILARLLPPGNYTVQLSGVGGTTGVGLIEVYEGIHDSPRLTNLSSRVFVGTGAGTAIAGIVVRGDVPKKLLLRAAGPALRQFHVDGPLADPALTLVDDANRVIAANNDWATAGNSAELAAAARAAGAFPLADDAKDAAVLVTVPPGSYSVVVTGADQTTGVALVEVYEVP